MTSWLALVVVLLVSFSPARSSHAQELQQTYSYHAVLDLEGKYTLYWNFDSEQETITFAVRVQTTGWVGFGLSPNGQMPSSDVVIGWVKGDESYFNVSCTSRSFVQKVGRVWSRDSFDCESRVFSNSQSIESQEWTQWIILHVQCVTTLSKSCTFVQSHFIVDHWYDASLPLSGIHQPVSEVNQVVTAALRDKKPDQGRYEAKVNYVFHAWWSRYTPRSLFRVWLACSWQTQLYRFAV